MQCAASVLPFIAIVIIIFFFIRLLSTIVVMISNHQPETGR